MARPAKPAVELDYEMMLAIEHCWHANLKTVRATAASPELQRACRERHKAALERGFILARTNEPPVAPEPPAPTRNPRKWHPAKDVTPGSKKDRLRQFAALPQAEQDARLYA
jgi:hypothetical protein